MNKFVELIPNQAARYGDREALRFRDYETQVWSSITWQGMQELVDRVALALLACGVEEQGRISVFTQNCPEILITHFGAFYNRAIPVPIYATSSKDEAAYIVNDAAVTVLFAGDQRQYDIARQLVHECPSLKQVVTLNPEVRHAPDDHSTLTWKQFLGLADGAGPEQMAVVEEKLFPAFEKAIGEERPHACSFTVLNRDDGDVSVIMRFDHKVGLFAGEFEEEADEEELSRVYGTVVVSEFNTLHRLMINFKAA